MQNLQLSESEIIHELLVREAREDFFAFRVFIHQKLKVGWWQIEVSRELQQFYRDYKDGLRPQLVIQAPPQHGKSVIINDFLLWIMGKECGPDADLKIIYAAFSDALSTRANRRIQRIYTSQRYQSVFPQFAPTHATQAQILFGADGYFRNTTTGGAITGESLDIGVIDDPVKGREAANSATIREKTWEWYTSDFRSRFSEYAAFLCILTRWHVDDVIGRLIEADSTVKVLRYPAIAEHDEQHRAAGEPLFSEHKSLEFLLKIKQVLSSAAWNSLYQQNPTLAEGNFFKPDFMQTVDIVPANLSYCRAWDLAATANGGDYTAGVKIGYDRHTQVAYIIDVVRGQYGPDEVEALLKATSSADGKGCKIRLPQDPGQAGKSQARSLVKLLSGYSVVVESVSGDKESRASPLAAQVNVGNVKLLRGAWNRAFVEELRLFPTGVNDDQVDSASDAYNNFNNSRTGMLDFYESLTTKTN